MRMARVPLWFTLDGPLPQHVPVAGLSSVLNGLDHAFDAQDLDHFGGRIGHDAPGMRHAQPTISISGKESLKRWKCPAPSDRRRCSLGTGVAGFSNSGPKTSTQAFSDSGPDRRDARFFESRPARRAS